MKIINNKKEILYQCEECDLIYKEKDWAQKCEKWCRETQSCNLEIIKHSVSQNNMKYGYTKQINLSFNESIEKVKEELSKEGFGVLTEINVKETLKKKLDVEFTNYIILGACNPVLAHKALQTEIEIGLLLPCNVIVYEKNEKIFVSGILPSVAMSMVSNEELKCVAKDVEEKIKKVINNIQ